MTARRLVLGGLAALAPVMAACGGGAASSGVAADPSYDPAGTASQRAIAAMHVSKCGACHIRPEPRTRTREHLEDALSRHRKRVRLTSDEWAALIDYLSMPPGNTARETR